MNQIAQFSELSQGILNLYAVNAVLVFLFFRPGTFGHRKLMSHPAVQAQPVPILILLLHVTAPLIILGLLQGIAVTLIKVLRVIAALASRVCSHLRMSAAS